MFPCWCDMPFWYLVLNSVFHLHFWDVWWIRSLLYQVLKVFLLFHLPAAATSCWSRNYNMNYWLIIRLPILIAIAVSDQEHITVIERQTSVAGDMLLLIKLPWSNSAWEWETVAMDRLAFVVLASVLCSITKIKHCVGVQTWTAAAVPR